MEGYISSCIKMLLEQCLAQGELTLIITVSDTKCSPEGLSSFRFYLLKSVISLLTGSLGMKVGAGGTWYWKCGKGHRPPTLEHGGGKILGVSAVLGGGWLECRKG